MKQTPQQKTRARMDRAASPETQPTEPANIRSWTDEQLNCEVAKLLGQRVHVSTADEIATGSYYQFEPQYCDDLNAMHEAEKLLCDLCDDVDPWELYDRRLGTNPTHATARQRAEAFVMVMASNQVGSNAERASGVSSKE